MTIQQVLAAIGFALCLALLVHHGLGARRQARLAQWWQARAARLHLAWLRQLQARRQRSTGEQARGQAERETADLIQRAKRGADRGGKVIRPRFGNRPKGPKDQRRDLH